MKSKLKIYTPSRTLTNKEEIEKEIHRISNDVYDVKWDYLARYARECVDPYGEEYIVVTSLCVGTRRGERGKLFFEVQAYEGKLKDAFRDDTTMYCIDKTPFDGNWDTVKDKLMQKSYYEMTEDEKSQTFIKNHPFCIEERARKVFGETDIFEFAGYMLEDGTMLNFSHEGYQRDEDHRIIGQFFEKAQGYDAIMKFMRRGNIRCSCGSFGYMFSFIKEPTGEQMRTMLRAYDQSGDSGGGFLIAKCNKDGKILKRYASPYSLEEQLAA